MKKKFMAVFVISLLCAVIYVFFNIISMYIYNSNTIGRSVNNVDEINVCNKIINNKYEILLYGRISKLNTLYTNKYNEKIMMYENSAEYNNLLENYFDHTINTVYKKFGNVYVIKYNVNYLDNSSKEFTMIIKFNFNKKRAIIIYDDMFN